MEKGGYVYIMTNHTNIVLYTGVTNDILRRVYEHKTGIGSKFTSKYNCNKLVYFEKAPEIVYAIEFEKKIKAGSRKSKIKLIEEKNPEWVDLAEGWYEIATALRASQ